MGHEHRHQTVAASPAFCGIAAARVMAAVAIWLAVWLPSLSQTLRGRVVDDMGNAVANASLYIGRLRQGFVADGDGRFTAVVPCGGYECRVSSLGYGTVTVPVTVDADTVTLGIVLHRLAYALTEVQVTGGGEDPALGIMRHVVARAPYNAVLPDTFVVETYVKGRGKFKRVPKLISLAASSDTMTRRLINSLFVMERVSRIEYKSPGHISEHVLAFTSTFPDALKGDEFCVTLPDFYSPTIYGCPSPVRGNVFGIYDYRLEGDYIDGGQLVHRIAFTPRKDVGTTLSGTICIIDSIWAIASADIEARLPVGKCRVRASFAQTAPGVYMPASQSAQCEFGLMGFVLDASYMLSASYRYVEPRSSATDVANAVSPAGTPGRKERKLSADVAALQDKPSPGNRDAVRLARKTQQLLDIGQRRRFGLHRYELASGLSPHVPTLDSLAARRDEGYWQARRMAVLDDEEAEAYSLARREALSRDSLGQTGHSDGGFDMVMRYLTTGYQWLGKSGKWWVKSGGLSDIMPAYNLVDGFWLGARLRAGRKIGDTMMLTTDIGAHWLSERHGCAWRAGLALDYAPMRLGRFEIEGGMTSSDYNVRDAETNLPVAFATSLFARNDVKFYERFYGSVTNSFEPVSGLRLSAGVTVERRTSLANAKGHNWFKREAAPNVPDNPLYEPMPRHVALFMTVSAEYTPVRWFVRRGGRKHYVGSDWPTFGVSYTKAVATGGLSPDYHRVEASVTHEAKVGHFNIIDWTLGAGMFAGVRRMSFADFKHFAATRFPVTGRRMDASYALTGNYEWSAADRWVQASAAWHTPRLLVNWLPFMRRLMLDEALHLRGLVTERGTVYWETGYSLGIKQALRAGVFVSFGGGHYRDVGFSLSIPLFAEAVADMLL